MRRWFVLATISLFACDAFGGRSGESQAPLTPSRVVLTQATFAPTKDRPSWLGGFSENDFWFASNAGGAFRSQQRGTPAAVPELDASRVGGPLSNPAFLASGDAFFTVLVDPADEKLVRWHDGAVDDVTTALVDSSSDFSRIAVDALAPSGEFVAVVRDASDARHLTFFSWSNGAFAPGPSFDLPSDLVTAKVAPVSSTEAFVVGADKTGLYRLARFDGTTLATLDADVGQLSAPFLATSSGTGFIAAGGLLFWTGSEFVNAPAPPDSPVFLPFAPDGLATIDSDGSTASFANPRVVVQHGAHDSTRYGIGDASDAESRHWFAAGIAGPTLLVMVDGSAPSDPSVVAIDLAP